MRKAVLKAGGTIEHRQRFALGDLFVADAWSSPPHENFASFMSRTGVVEDMDEEYPHGVWVTMWWLETREEALGVPGGIMTFDPKHDFGSRGRKRMRVNAALDKAADAMNELHRQKLLESLHVH